MLTFLNTLFANIAAIGAGPEGGSSRIAFSPEDQQVRALFAQNMVESGLTVRVDAFGNLFGRLEGTDPSAPVVATGSHLDTVPQGGSYDGVLGCVTGLAVLRHIAMQQKQGLMQPLTHSLECIAFQSEESSRFSTSTLGSKFLSGIGKAAILGRLTDAQGNTLEDVLHSINLSISHVEEALLPPNYCKAFIELHNDQGPELEDAQIPLGIVSHIVGIRRASLTFEGFASHAGGTPMALRRDALVAAAETVLALNTIANSYEGKYSMVGTVGNVSVEPGAINVVPGKTSLLCELRATDAAMLDTAWADFCARVNEIATQYACPATLVMKESSKPVPMSAHIQKMLTDNSAALGYAAMPMASGGGHDSMNMATITDVGMLFVRSRDGLSHHPDEFVTTSDIAAGFHVLRETLIALAQ